MSEFTGAVYERDLPPRLQAVVLALAQHVNHKRAEAGDYRIWPSVDRLAWMLGINYRTVQRRLRELEELGVLRVVEGAGYREARTYDFNLDACEVKPPAKSRPRAKGVSRDALAEEGKGVTGGREGRQPRSTRASTRVEKGVTAATPEVEEVEEEALKEVPESNGLTPPLDKEQFFEKKKAQIRDELEEKAAKGSIWHEAILVSEESQA